MVVFKNIKMNLRNIFLLFCLLISNSILLGQTAGFNYQALILSDEKIQIPGTDVTRPSTPLTSKEIIIRFTISNDTDIEYTEEHTIFTDEFGMVSLIVGGGNPITSSFPDINWDGKSKFLDVELKILHKDDDFTLIDSQKILHIPSPGSTTNTNTYSSIKIITSLDELTPPFNNGDLVWITNYGENNNTTLLIWNETQWIPVNEDFDTKNELRLISVSNTTTRNKSYPKPKTGDVVWNRNCKCVQVYDVSSWTSIITKASNGLTLSNGNIKLGGKLQEATILETSNTNTLAITGLETDPNNNNNVVVIDKNGVLKQTSKDTFINNLKVKEIIVYANDGQQNFSTPVEISNSNNVNVYRNGINIGFSIVNKNTIKLEPEAICYKNDKVRIVQLY